MLFPFSIILLTFVLFDEAKACSCAFGGAAPCQQYWRTDVVFTGLVTGSTKVEMEEGTYKSQRRLVRFEVVEPSRGIQAAQAEVITGWGGGDCGYQFEVGETYLVYAQRDEKNDRLHTSICTRTRPLSEASADLQYIRGLSTAETTAVVFGSVKKRNYSRKEGESVFKPVGSVELVIEGEGARVETRTDGEGNYRVAGLAPGAYTIRLEVPKGLTSGSEGASSAAEGKVEVVGRGCGQADFYFESDTRVSGRVIDSLGQPVPNFPVRMRGAPSDVRNINTFLYAQTDVAGRFEFKTVPPGDYLLGFRLLTESGGETLPYPRTYYPGVGLKGQAGIIRVSEGEHLPDVELRMPPPMSEYSVEGFVVWSDGRPAPGVYIYLSQYEEGEMSSSTSLKADERGRFTLKLFDGLRYMVSAYPSGATGPEAQSKWVEVPRVPGIAPIKLVLPVLKK